MVLLTHGANMEAQTKVKDFSLDNNDFIYLSSHVEYLYLF